MKNKRYLTNNSQFLGIIITTILCIVVVLPITGVANAQTQNLTSKADLQSVASSLMSNIQQSFQSIFATKTELHDTASSLSKDVQTLNANINNLFDSLRSTNNNTISLQNRVTVLEEARK